MAIKITREIRDENEEMKRAMEAYLEGLEGYDYEGPNGNRIAFTHRGFCEFFDGCSRVIGGGVKNRGFSHMPGAANVISNNSGDKMELLFSTVEKLPSIVKNMHHVKSDENTKQWQKPDVISLEHYETNVEILGKKYIVNLTTEVRDRGEDYYFHFLKGGRIRESVMKTNEFVVRIELTRL